MTVQENLFGSVLLITHKRTKQLLTVIGSLEESWIDSYIELLVVIHESEPRVKEIVDSIKFKPPKILNVVRNEISTPQEAISRNIFEGLSNAFLNSKIDYVTVLEDDIMVRKDFLSFNASIMAIESGQEKFKGINGFSGAKYNPEADLLYSRFRYGFGWGWTVTRKTWNEIKKVWASDFESHWDSLVEPYIRRGFVVMGHNSRILNLGFDAFATHTVDGGAQEENLNNSFENPVSINYQSDSELKYSKFNLNWREDVFNFIETSSLRGRCIDFLFLVNLKMRPIHKFGKIEYNFKVKFKGILFRVIDFLSY